MSNSLDLLRMLEPVVRPGQSGGSPRRQAPLPIEERSFESLLQEIEAGQGTNETLPAEPGEPTGGADDTRAHPLSPLSDLDAITNASLRDLIARNRRSGAADGPIADHS